MDCFLSPSGSPGQSTSARSLIAGNKEQHAFHRALVSGLRAGAAFQPEFGRIGEKHQESLHVLFFLMRPVRQTDTPELVLRFHSFDTRLHFRRRELPNPGDAELCLFGPALQLVPTF